MSFGFTYGNSTINSSGGFILTKKNAPTNPREVVDTYADIANIPNPYVGLTVTVKADETNNNKMTDYKVISLKSNNLGIADMLIDQVQRMDEYLGVLKEVPAEYGACGNRQQRHLGRGAWRVDAKALVSSGGAYRLCVRRRGRRARYCILYVGCSSLRGFLRVVDLHRPEGVGPFRTFPCDRHGVHHLLPGHVQCRCRLQGTADERHGAAVFQLRRHEPPECVFCRRHDPFRWHSFLLRQETCAAAEGCDEIDGRW